MERGQGPTSSGWASLKNKKIARQVFERSAEQANFFEHVYDDDNEPVEMKIDLDKEAAN
jgi:hypothetical protein